MSTVAGASKARPNAVPARRSKLRRRLRTAFWCLVSGFSVFSITLAIVFIPRLNEAESKIPNLPAIIAQVNSQPSVVISDDGETLYSMQGQYRRAVSIEDVPQVVINATIAAEDKRFYKHDGVDYKGLTGIFFQTLLSGDVPRGGSTLTMQLAKRVYTSPEQTLDRKLDDMALAMVIERSLTKDQILELYLNQVYYGRRAYGIGAAADVYFGKKLDELTLGETAMLARMVRRPSDENPFDNLKASIKNRDLVLRLMLEEDMISEKDYEAAKKEKPKLAKIKPPTVSGEKLAPFFVDAVLREVQRDFPDVDLKLGGYRIETTLNWKIQKYAEEQVAKTVKSMKSRRVTTGAMLLWDSDGAVIVHVGGANYKVNEFDIITQGARQPGSSFKPIMYATAFENHVVTPRTVISNGTFFWDGGGGNPVQVHNSEGGSEADSYTVEQGIILSKNVIAARVMVMTGPSNVVAVAKNSFGYKSDLQAYPSLALGATACSPLEMARAYSVFKTGGNRIEPYFIRRIIGPNGDVVKRYGPRVVRNVISTGTARTMDTILYKAANWGTGGPVARTGVHNLHGKTGTTNDYRDAWFCGYTDRFIGVAWVGGEVRVGDRWEYRSMNRVFGGSTAGPFWGRIVLKAQELLGEQTSKFEPYYGSNQIDVEPDPSGAGFEELPPLDPDKLPPLDDGARATGSAPRRNQAPPTMDPGRNERTLDIVYVEVCADTGGVASVYCPERVKKPFLDGSQPKSTCPLHKPPH